MGAREQGVKSEVGEGEVDNIGCRFRVGMNVYQIGLM